MTFKEPLENLKISHKGNNMTIKLHNCSSSLKLGLNLAINNLRFTPGDYKISCNRFVEIEKEKFKIIKEERLGRGFCSSRCLDITPDSLRYTPDTTRKE